jgi:hypothetical protein
MTHRSPSTFSRAPKTCLIEVGSPWLLRCGDRLPLRPREARELAVDAFHAALGMVHCLVPFQGIGQPRCGLSLALLDRPWLLPGGDVAWLALLPLEDDAGQHDPCHPDGPANRAPPPWALVSPEHAKTVLRISHITHHVSPAGRESLAAPCESSLFGKRPHV